MLELAGWDSFYVIIATSAGALIGLQFVVMTLVAANPPAKAHEAGPAFATPTIVHFGSVLLLSALLRAPWHAITIPAILCGLIGIAGAAYSAIVAWRMRKQGAYQPDFEDWLFHTVLPMAAYALLVLAAFTTLARVHVRAALFGVGAAALLLLFIGIHNAWDAVAYHVFVNLRRSDTERGRREETLKKE
jgi:hypothetical protein